MMSSWKIATINVQGINNQEKFNDVIHWIDSNNIDITILTETKLSSTTAFFTSLIKKNIQPTEPRTRIGPRALV